MNDKYPEINVNLIGSRIRILDKNGQPWVKPGQELTVRNVTRNNKFQFNEIKYAWGCENNGVLKFFQVLEYGTEQPKPDIEKLKKKILQDDQLSMDQMLTLIDDLINAKESTVLTKEGV